MKIKRTTGPAVISHRNITRVIDVYATVLPGHDVGSVVGAIEDRLLASAELAPVLRQSDRGAYFEIGGPEFAGKGYSLNLTGEVQTMRESFQGFAFGLVIAVVLVYLVMVAQMRSFLDPVVGAAALSLFVVPSLYVSVKGSRAGAAATRAPRSLVPGE